MTPLLYFKVLNGGAEKVAVELRRNATCAQLGQDKRQPVDKCASYLEKYSPMLGYDDFLSQGLPIASGVIEGACRHLIKDRLDRTGARWRMRSAEAIIRIRSLRSSGDFKAYWEFHRQQELHRNHLCHYTATDGNRRVSLEVVSKDLHQNEFLQLVLASSATLWAKRHDRLSNHRLTINTPCQTQLQAVISFYSGPISDIGAIHELPLQQGSQRSVGAPASDRDPVFQRLLNS